MPKWTLNEILAIVPVHGTEEQCADPVRLSELNEQAADDFELFGGAHDFRPRENDEQSSRTNQRGQDAIADESFQVW